MKPTKEGYYWAELYGEVQPIKVFKDKSYGNKLMCMMIGWEMEMDLDWGMKWISEIVQPNKLHPIVEEGWAYACALVNKCEDAMPGCADRCFRYQPPAP